MALFDWRAMLGQRPEKNPYLRLSQTDRDKLSVRVLIFLVLAPFMLWGLIWLTRWLGL
jgi:hypothetical protein